MKKETVIKKIVAVLVAMVLLASNSAVAMAEGVEPVQEEGKEELPEPVATGTDLEKEPIEAALRTPRISPVSVTATNGIYYGQVDGVWGLYENNSGTYTRVGYENIYWSTTGDGALTMLGSMNLGATGSSETALSFYGKRLTIRENETLTLNGTAQGISLSSTLSQQSVVIELKDGSKLSAQGGIAGLSLENLSGYRDMDLEIIGGSASVATLSLESAKSSFKADNANTVFKMSGKLDVQMNSQGAQNTKVNLDLSGDVHLQSECEHSATFNTVTMSDNAKITSTSISGYNQFPGLYIKTLQMSDNAQVSAYANTPTGNFKAQPGYEGSSVSMSGKSKLTANSLMAEGIRCGSIEFTGGTPEIIAKGEAACKNITSVTGVDLIGASVDKDAPPATLYPYSNVNGGEGGITYDGNKFYLHGYDIQYLKLVGDKVPPVISIASIATGIKGEAYAQAMATSSGKEPITWALVTGPAWLLINTTTGALSGTPTADGTATVTVRATNASGSDEKTYSLTVYAKPEITTVSLPNGTMNQAYSATIDGTGTAPVTWSISSGALPAGLNFNASTRTISGTPTAAGSFSITVQGTNTYGTASRSLSLFIAEPPAITTESLPIGITGTAYSASITGTGNPTPDYLVESGNFPPGLNLSSSGAISGTPTTAGNYTFTVKSQNGYGFASKSFTIAIGDAPAITTTTLPDATLNQAYSAVLTGTGTEPITWSITGGALPAGLSFNAASKTISGTPTAAGSFSITLQAASAYGKATKALNLFVGTPPSITTTALQDGITAESYSQTLTASGTAPLTWTVVDGALPAGLSLNSSGVISGTPTTDCTAQAVTIKAENAYGEATKELTITVRTKVSIVTASIPSAPAGKEYEVKLEVAGTAPYMWTVVSGNFPAGLKLASDGTIYGTPLAEDTYKVTLKVANLISDATREFTIAISGTVPEITTESLPPITVDEGYSVQLQASGTQPLSWRLTDGALPDGCTLASSGVISGIPNQVGRYTFIAEVANSYGTDAKDFSIIVANPVKILTESVKNGATNDTYLQFMNASGTTPMTWTVAAGSLPPGLQISDSMGFLYGTPETAGAYSFTLKAENAVSQDTREFSMLVGDRPILEPEDPDNPSSSVKVDSEGNLLAIQYESFTYTIPRKGSGDFAWEVLYGNLPEGLTLDTSTGTISGVPSIQETQTAVIQASTAYGSATLHLTIKVLERVAITQESLPPGGIDTPYVKLIETKGTYPIVWAIISGALPEGLSLDENTGIISGTPVRAEESTFEIHAANGVSDDQKVLTLKTGAPPMAEGIEPDENGNYRVQFFASVNEPFQESLKLTGAAPMRWSITHGELPKGLDIDAATGVIAGTPTTVENCLATVRAENDFGSFSLKVSITVADRVRIQTEALRTTAVGLSYTQDLAADGTKPITWRTASAFPAGLSLNAESGRISGTAEELGRFDVMMKAQNAVSEDNKSYVLIVKNRLNIEGGGTLPEGEKDKEYEHDLETNPPDDGHWSIIEGELPPGLVLDPDTGEISGTPSESGDWTVIVGVETEDGYGEEEITIIIKDKEKDSGSGDGSGSGGDGSSGGHGSGSGGHGSSGGSNVSKGEDINIQEELVPAWLDADAISIEGASIFIDDTEHEGMKAKIYPSRSLAVAKIDGDTLNSAVMNAKRYITAYIPDDGANALTVELPLSLFVAADNNVPVTLQFGDKVGYQLTGAAFDVSGILRTVGAASAREVSLKLTLNTAADEATSKLAEAAIVHQNGCRLILPPMVFTVVAEHNGRTAEVQAFERYVSRIVPLTEGEAAATTTAVRMDANGDICHVPTEVYESSRISYLPPHLQQGNAWLAKINSRTNSQYALIGDAHSFADADGSWYKTTVDEMAERRIVFGIGNDRFAGSRSVTRAEFTAIVIRALGLSEKTSTAAFSDISPSDWYYDAVNTAAQYDIAQGYTDGRFAPDANISRQEAMAMVERAAAIAELGGARKSIDAYNDSSLVSEWAVESVKYNVGSSLIVGETAPDGSYLKPLREITRAESAAVVLRMLREAGLVDVRN